MFSTIFFLKGLIIKHMGQSRNGVGLSIFSYREGEWVLDHPLL